MLLHGFLTLLSNISVLLKLEFNNGLFFLRCFSFLKSCSRGPLPTHCDNNILSVSVRNDVCCLNISMFCSRPLSVPLVCLSVCLSSSLFVFLFVCLSANTCLFDSISLSRLRFSFFVN